MLLRSELFCIFYFFKGEIRAYFGASFLFFDLFALSVSTSLMTFFIGEAVSFIGSVMGGLSLRSSLLLLRKKKLIYQSKLFPLHRHFCQFFFSASWNFDFFKLSSFLLLFVYLWLLQVRVGCIASSATTIFSMWIARSSS